MGQATAVTRLGVGMVGQADKIKACFVFFNNLLILISYIYIWYKRRSVDNSNLTFRVLSLK